MNEADRLQRSWSVGPAEAPGRSRRTSPPATAPRRRWLPISTAVTTTVSFAAGDTIKKTVTIPINNHALVEADETVNLTLTSPTGRATLGSPATAVLTIVDETAPPIGSLTGSVTNSTAAAV